MSFTTRKLLHLGSKLKMSTRSALSLPAYDNAVPSYRTQSRKKSLRCEVLEDRCLPAVVFNPGSLLAPAVNRTDIALGTISGFAPVEPAISVNPFDPGNIAVSSHNAIKLTTNAGATFTSAVSFVSPAGSTSFGGDTTTAYDSTGRLFWSNLAGPGTLGIAVDQINPTTGANITTASAGANNDDKQDLFVDTNPSSPFFNNLYVVWTRFGVSPAQIFISRSSNLGVTWSAPLQLSTSAESFTWPVTGTVAPNGDVYVAYHSQTGFGTQNPNGTTGKIVVVRSTNGGVSFPQKTFAFTAGNADITFNVQTSGANRTIPQTQFWTQGSGQPYIMADPNVAGKIYVIANDDPNNGGAGDPANVVLATSTDNGNTWSTSTVVSGPSNSFQFFPTAAIDKSGVIVVAWYDNRRGLVNGNNRFKLDVMATYSTNGGGTWAPEFMVNDPGNPFDPDPGAVNRFNGPPPTTRIGEYFGLDVFGGTAYLAWNGNSYTGATPTGHQVTYDAFPINGGLTVNGDDAGVTNDTFTLRLMAGNTGFVEVLVNGQRQYVGLKAALSGGIVFNGIGGNDTVNLDFTNGNPIPTGGVGFDGGVGIDRYNGTNNSSVWTKTNFIDTYHDNVLNYDLLMVNVENFFGGTGGNIYNVLSSAAGTKTNIIGNSGVSTINIGSAGSVQGVLGTVNIENPPAFNTISIDDSADATGRTATISPLGANPDDQSGTNAFWAQLTGLAPGIINFQLNDTAAGVGGLSISLGTGADALNVAPDASGAARTYTINAGNPAAPNLVAADFLTLNLAGVATPVLVPTANGAGTWTFGNAGPVVFSNFERMTPGISFSGRVFQDLNNNGNDDGGTDPGMGSVFVNVDSLADGTPDLTTLSVAGTGNYSFTDLAPGQYRIRQVVPGGFVQSTVNPADFTFSAALSNTGIHFGNFPSDTTAPTIAGLFFDTPTSTLAWRTAAGDAINGYPAQTGAGQLVPMPWAVSVITVVFSEPVVPLTGVEIGVRGINNAGYGGSFVTVSATTVRITISSPIFDTDWYILDLDGNGGAGAIRDLAGNFLAGTFVENVSTFPTSGAAAQDFKYRFKIGVGDVDRNGQIRNADVNLVRANLFVDAPAGGYNIFADINADGLTRNADINLVRSHLFVDPPTGPGPSRPVRGGSAGGRGQQALSAGDHYVAAKLIDRDHAGTTLRRLPVKATVQAIDRLFEDI